MITILMLTAFLLFPAYKKGIKVKYSGSIGKVDIKFNESIITASQKNSQLFYVISFTVAGGRSLNGSYLVSEKGYLQKFSISDSDREQIYKLVVGDEALVKVNEFSGGLKREIPQRGGSYDGIFLPFFPACWHFLMKSRKLIENEKIKVKVAIPFYDKDANAGHPLNFSFAEHSEFTNVTVKMQLSKEGEKYLIKVSPFKAGITIDADYNILSFEWQGYDLKKE